MSSNFLGPTTMSLRIEVQDFFKDVEANQLFGTFTHKIKRDKGVSTISALSMEKCIKTNKIRERDIYMQSMYFMMF